MFSPSFSPSRPSGASAVASAAACGCVAPVDPVALGTHGENTCPNASEDSRKARRENRLARFAAKRKAAELIRPHAEKYAGRISRCCYVGHGDKVELQHVTRADGSTSGRMAGLVTCGSVWACPICSQRISETRREELNALLAWARAEGHRVVMLTLTARHNVRTELAAFVDDLRAASTAMRQSKAWRALPLVGTVTAMEVTHGRNGFHPHSHVLMVFERGAREPVELVETLRKVWLHRLGRVGREGNAAAFQVQNGDQAGEYVAKWGAGEELALGVKKLGRNGSRSPWQLLADARDGDGKAGALFAEYALAFKGKRQLVWSKGLKALAGVDEKNDAEASEETQEPGETVVMVRAWNARGDGWKAARRRSCALLDAVETGGDIDRAEYGQTDAERWRAVLSESCVVETLGKVRK